MTIQDLHPASAQADIGVSRPVAETAAQGLRVFTAGHSFHVFIAPLLAEMARAAGIAGHVVAGTQFLGGSRVIEHWHRPDPVNEAKQALRAGRVDVLTLSPTIHPDPGIEYFLRLAHEQNPRVRATVQTSWVPFDGVLAATLYRTAGGRDAYRGDDLRRLHAPYFHSLNDEVEVLRRQYDDAAVLSVVPVGQALIALREQIRAGSAAGLQSQNELFIDDLGHPALPVQVLAAYAHFAVIYRRNPVGLPAPSVLADLADSGGEQLNRLLQQLAWDAVVRHPLSGLTAAP